MERSKIKTAETNFLINESKKNPELFERETFIDSPDFLEKIQNREIEARTVAFMTHQEMNPGKWRDLIQKQRLIEANKLENNIEASTDMFTCRKCRSKKCTYYEAQTRSGDEASTIFVTCLDCGKNWTC